MRGSFLIAVDDEAELELVREWFRRWTKQLTGMRTDGCGCCVLGYVVEGPNDAIAAIPTSIRRELTPDDEKLTLKAAKNPYPMKAKERRQTERKGKR